MDRLKDTLIDALKGFTAQEKKDIDREVLKQKVEAIRLLRANKELQQKFSDIK